MKWKCFFKGHYHTGYDPCCNRCGKHDYFDSVDADPGCRNVDSYFSSYEFTLPTMFRCINIWLRHHFETSKCKDCKKREKFLGFNVGNHDDCLPF